LQAGRNYVIPDDVKRLSYPVLRHRLGRTFDALANNVTPESLIDAVFEAVRLPAPARATARRAGVAAAARGGGRAQALARFARAGQLPVGAFGELMREKLDAPMAEMFETYLEEISRCPTVLPDEAFLWPEQPSVSPPAPASRPGGVRACAARPTTG